MELLRYEKENPKNLDISLSPDDLNISKNQPRHFQPYC